MYLLFVSFYSFHFSFSVLKLLTPRLFLLKLTWACTYTDNTPLHFVDPCNYAAGSKGGAFGLEVGSCYLCWVRKGVHSALSANWSSSPQDLQVEWILCQTCKKPSLSLWCYRLKISVKWIMHQKPEKNSFHLFVGKILTSSRWKKEGKGRGEAEVLCSEGWSERFGSSVTTGLFGENFKP